MFSSRQFQTTMAGALLAARLCWSRRQIYKAIGSPRQLTFVRSYGNTGDQFIEAGIRTLLSEYNVVELIGYGLDLGDASGDVAVIAGGGAWCQPYHEFMPKLLPELERRFKKVVVLPSSFDVNVPDVRVALENSNAIVFARERVSFSGIRNLCAAQLAHDCAFYFDLRKYHQSGAGTLNAFRTDKESALLRGAGKLPPDNNDISITCPSLDSWLETISRYGTIRTDRAHIMIAAALLGKNVEITSSSYHKVPAISSFSLTGFPIRIVSIREV